MAITIEGAQDTETEQLHPPGALMSHIAAIAPFAAPRWYVTGALPEPVKTAHLTERDPEDRRYARSVCGVERARLWDCVEVTTSDNAVEICFECASTMPTTAPVCQATDRVTRRRRPKPRRQPAEQLELPLS